MTWLSDNRLNVFSGSLKLDILGFQLCWGERVRKFSSKEKTTA
uniref:Uncharacterized protein n=1 Tax=Arundo donax TaxID=35708 RepID=A0A0A8ZDS9_ARUDO